MSSRPEPQPVHIPPSLSFSSQEDGYTSEISPQNRPLVAHVDKAQLLQAKLPANSRNRIHRQSPRPTVAKIPATALLPNMPMEIPRARSLSISSSDEASISSHHSATTVPSGHLSKHKMKKLPPRVAAVLMGHYLENPKKRSNSSTREGLVAHVDVSKKTKLRPKSPTESSASSVSQRSATVPENEEYVDDDLSVLAREGRPDVSNEATYISDEEDYEWKVKVAALERKSTELSNQVQNQSKAIVHIGLKYKEASEELQAVTQKLNHSEEQIHKSQEQNRLDKEKHAEEAETKERQIQSQGTELHVRKERITELGTQADLLLKENKELVEMLEAKRLETSLARETYESKLKELDGAVQERDRVIRHKDSVLAQLKGQTQELERIKLGLSIQIQRLEWNQQQREKEDAEKSSEDEMVRSKHQSQLQSLEADLLKEQARAKEVFHQLQQLSSTNLALEERAKGLEVSRMKTEGELKATQKELDEVQKVNENRILKLQNSLKAKTKALEDLESIQEQLKAESERKENSYTQDIKDQEGAFAEEKERLEAEIEQLSSLLKSTRDKLQEEEMEHQKAKKDIKTLQISLADKEDEAERAQTEFVTLENGTNDLKEQVASLELESTKLRELVEESNCKLEELERHHKKSKQELDQLRGREEEHNRNVQVLQASLMAKGSELQAALTQRNSILTQMEVLRNSVTVQASQQNEMIARERGILKSKIDDAKVSYEQDLRKVSISAQEARAECSRLRNANDRMKQETRTEVAALKEQLSESKESLEEKDRRIVSLEKELKESEEAQENLQISLKNLKTEISELEKEHEKSIEEHTSAKAKEIDLLKQQSLELQIKLEKLEQQTKKLQKRLDNEDLRELLRQAKLREARANQTIGELESVSDALKKECDHLKNELRAIKAELTDTQDLHKLEIDKLDELLVEKLALLRKSLASIVSLEEQRNVGISDSLNLREECDSLREELDCAHAELRKYRDDKQWSLPRGIPSTIAKSGDYHSAEKDAAKTRKDTDQRIEKLKEESEIKIKQLQSEISFLQAKLVVAQSDKAVSSSQAWFRGSVLILTCFAAVTTGIRLYARSNSVPLEFGGEKSAFREDIDALGIGQPEIAEGVAVSKLENRLHLSEADQKAELIAGAARMTRKKKFFEFKRPQQPLGIADSAGQDEREEVNPLDTTLMVLPKKVEKLSEEESNAITEVENATDMDLEQPQVQTTLGKKVMTLLSPTRSKRGVAQKSDVQTDGDVKDFPNHTTPGPFSYEVFGLEDFTADNPGVPMALNLSSRQFLPSPEAVSMPPETFMPEEKSRSFRTMPLWALSLLCDDGPCWMEAILE